MILGFDPWSAYRCAWERLPEQGIRWAYIRCTEALRGIDVEYDNNIEGAARAGIYYGAYFPLHVDLDPDAQVGHFIAHANGVGKGPGQLPPCVDLEVPWPWTPVGRELARARVVRTVELLEQEFGRPPTVYTNAGWWGDLDAGASDEERTVLARCLLWVASWPFARPWTPTDATPCPRGFGPWSRPRFWQYSALHSEPLPGVLSPACPLSGAPGHGQCQQIDRDIFLGTPEELAVLARVTLPGIDVAAETLRTLPTDDVVEATEADRRRDRGEG
jgi:hypothetical protein